MIFKIGANGNPVLSEIQPQVLVLLDALSIDPCDHSFEITQRLFPSPGQDEELCRDWVDYVHPELHKHFTLERSVVAGDLKNIISMSQSDKGNPEFYLEIPRVHCDAWITTLNVLRLALATKYGFTEEDLSQKEIKKLATERDFDLMKVNFYAFIQEFLIQVIMKP